MSDRGFGVATSLVAAGVLGAFFLGLAAYHIDDQVGRLEAYPLRPSAVTPQASGLERPACAVSDILVPECGRWWGVAPEQLTDVPPEEALRRFETDIGRPVDIYHTYHRDDSPFPTAQEVNAARGPGSPRLLFLNWKPDTTATWRAVANGSADERLDELAAHILRTFPERFFLTIWHEPENDVIPRPGSGMTARDYAAMYRHVVTRLRERGVTNAVTVMVYMGSPDWGLVDWFEDLYPGDDVVDWIGADPYVYAVPQGNITGGFRDIVNRRAPGWPGFYSWAQSQFPDKPIMIGEWGVFHSNENPDRKAWVFRSISRDIHRFPAIKALVYYDSPNAPKGDTRIDSTPESLKTFRELGMLPEFVAPPVPPR